MPQCKEFESCWLFIGWFIVILIYTNDLMGKLVSIERNTVVIQLHFLKLLLSLFGSAFWWVLEAPLHLGLLPYCIQKKLF